MRGKKLCACERVRWKSPSGRQKQHYEWGNPHAKSPDGTYRMEQQQPWLRSKVKGTTNVTAKLSKTGRSCWKWDNAHSLLSPPLELLNSVLVVFGGPRTYNALSRMHTTFCLSFGITAAQAQSEGESERRRRKRDGKSLSLTGERVTFARLSSYYWKSPPLSHFGNAKWACCR